MFVFLKYSSFFRTLKYMTIVEYFGYGANRDPDMMHAIVGRMPVGYEATLSGYELAIEKWDEIPPSVRRILSGAWTPTFRTYFVRPVANSTSRVKGMVWQLTPLERRLVDNWELTGEWYKTTVLSFAPSKGEATRIEIQVMHDSGIGHQVDGMRYRSYLNSRSKMLNVARECCRQYLSLHRHTIGNRH